LLMTKTKTKARILSTCHAKCHFVIRTVTPYKTGVPRY